MPGPAAPENNGRKGSSDFEPMGPCGILSRGGVFMMAAFDVPNDPTPEAPSAIPEHMVVLLLEAGQRLSLIHISEPTRPY